MLRWYQTGRLAPKHSPTREQRELLFAGGTHAEATGNTPDDGKTNEAPMAASPVVDVFLDTRNKLSACGIIKRYDDPRKLIQKNLYLVNAMTGWKLSEADAAAMTKQDASNIIADARKRILEKLAEGQKGQKEFIADLSTLDIDTSKPEDLREFCDLYATTINTMYPDFYGPTKDPIHAVSMLQGVFQKDIERERNNRLKPAQGVQYSFLSDEQAREVYRREREKSGEKVQEGDTKVPSAFSYGRTVAVNIDHPDFATSEKNRERAIAHEVTHVVLKRMENNLSRSRRLVQELMKDESSYQSIANEIRTIYGEPYLPHQDGWPRVTMYRDRAAEEVAAIYLTQKLYPIESETDRPASYPIQERIASTMEHAINSNGILRDLIMRIERDVASELRSSDGRFDAVQNFRNAVEDRKTANALSQVLSKPGVWASRDESGTYVAHSADTSELMGAVKNEIDDADAHAEHGGKSAIEIMRAAQGAKNRLKDIQTKYETVRKDLSEKSANDPAFKQWEKEFATNIEAISQTANDLTATEHAAEILQQWNLPEQSGGPTLEERKTFAQKYLKEEIAAQYNALRSNASWQTIEAINESCTSEMQALTTVMDGTVSKIVAVVEKIEKALETMDEGSEGVGHVAPNVWMQFKRLFSSSGGTIVWVTPLNIINIFNTYKQAVIDNYSSNQKVKENKYAKYLNFYQPIDHTLKQIARSTNNEETSKFAEYIKTEGYTFDDIFGPDGKGLQSGLLYDNRHNFNRAKAVIEYAAERGLLYFLDRFDGSNVYGIDYVKEEGLQSFDELVHKNEQGKKHEIDHGYERIDVDADVPPIIDTLIHELHDKKIFAAVGIMKRLQEKAKFSHSNAWAAVTFISAMRGKYSHDPHHMETLLHVMDKGALDQIGGIGIGQSAWTLTMFKTLRHALEKWKNGQLPFANEENPLCTVIDQIEKKYKKYGITFEGEDHIKKQKNMDEATAMILAGKTYKSKDGKHKISIFDDEFSEYRNYWLGTPTTTSAKESDDDWFNPSNGGSDILLLGPGATEEILRRRSQGDFEIQVKAQGYFAQVFMRDNELAKEGLTGAQANFRREIQGKLQAWLNHIIAQQAAKKALPSDITGSYGDPPEAAEVAHLNIVYELHRRNMMSKEQYSSLLKGIDIADCRPDNPNHAEYLRLNPKK